VRGRVDLPSRAGVLRLVAREVQPSRLLRGAPAISVSGTIDLAGRVAQHALEGRIRLEGGSASVDGQQLSDVAADTQARLARDGELQVHRLSGQWMRRPFQARGALRWSPRQIEISGADVNLAGAQARTDARYQLADHHLWLRAEPLRLSPALVSRLLRRPAAKPWTGRIDLEGTRGDVTMTVETLTSFGALRLAAHLLQAGARVDLRRVEAWLGDSHLYGAAHYQAGRISASVEELVLSPALVHQLEPELSPAWPIRLRGALAGRQLFKLSLALDAGPSTARLSGRFSARQFQLAAQLDSFDVTVLRPSQRRVRATLALAANGRFDKGGAVGTVTIHDARGYILQSPFYDGVAEAQLDGRAFTLTRARVEIPGARLMGTGSGALGDVVKIRFGVVITNALALRRVPEGLRVLIGINSILPGRSVTGSITKRPGQKTELRYRVLPIGIAQLEFLLRVITGRLPRFETRL
jgi:hypothetical protein